MRLESFAFPNPVRAPLLGCAVAVLLNVGCANLGPKAVQAGRTDYNLVLSRTSDEQLLLNLVRLKYRDNAFFLEVSAVTTQFVFNPQASASTAFGSGLDNGVQIGGSFSYQEQPTVSYTPLQGQDFVQRVLTPVSLDTLLLLSSSGWSSERLLRTCVDRINGVPNAPRASGPTPTRAPEYERFLRVTELWRELELASALYGAYLNEGGKAVPVIHFTAEARDLPQYRELIRLLGLKPGLPDYRLSVGVQPGKGDTINIEPRSFAGVMYFLSQSVGVPAEDQGMGRVTVTRTPSGGLFDWARVTQGIMNIHSSASPPTNAAVAVRYRGSWFYIDDSDLDSKSTFGLLGQLFALQAGSVKGVAPVLTLPVGG